MSSEQLHRSLPKKALPINTAASPGRSVDTKGDRVPAQRKASLRHLDRACLSRLSPSTFPGGRRQQGHPDLPWSGGAKSVTEAAPVRRTLFSSVSGREGALVPGRQLGPSQPRRPGPLHFRASLVPPATTNARVSTPR